MAKTQLATGSIAAVVVASLTAAALATPGSGTTGVVVARAAFAADSVNIKLSLKEDLRGRETVHVRNAEDTVMQQIIFAPGGHSGWHSHPGPAVILIKSGELTFYEEEGGECVSRTYSAGQALVDSGQGHVHLAQNTSAGDTEVWVTYFDVPAGGSPRIDVPAAPAACAS
jgi:quercetin dioxygenase-like cupin family protein